MTRDDARGAVDETAAGPVLTLDRETKQFAVAGAPALEVHYQRSSERLVPTEIEVTVYTGGPLAGGVNATVFGHKIDDWGDQTEIPTNASWVHGDRFHEDMRRLAIAPKWVRDIVTEVTEGPAMAADVAAADRAARGVDTVPALVQLDQAEAHAEARLLRAALAWEASEHDIPCNHDDAKDRLRAAAVDYRKVTNR